MVLLSMWLERLRLIHCIDLLHTLRYLQLFVIQLKKSIDTRIIEQVVLFFIKSMLLMSIYLWLNKNYEMLYKAREMVPNYFLFKKI